MRLWTFFPIYSKFYEKTYPESWLNYFTPNKDEKCYDSTTIAQTRKKKKKKNAPSWVYTQCQNFLLWLTCFTSL